MLKRLTYDISVMQIVSNCLKDFEPPEFPVRDHGLKEIRFEASEAVAIAGEISKFLGKKISSEVTPDLDQFLSKIFTRPKPNDTVRVIFELSRLNGSISYKLFKWNLLKWHWVFVSPQLVFCFS